MAGDAPISGFATAPFEGVRNAFALNFSENLELGASFAAFIDGEPVISLHGGFTDRARESPWTGETLAGVYSSGKAAVAMLVARAVSDGLLDYDAPVARYWPEFAAKGKKGVTVAEALSHQAGLCGFPEEMPPEEWLDWDAICARLAAMAPLWEPGSACGYHPQTFGFIAGELLRRTTGRSVGEILRKDFQEAHGLNVICGMEDSETARAAFMPKPPRAPDLGPLTELKRIAFLKPWSAPAKVKREEWMAAEIPASNIHADARSLAEITQPLANEGKFRGRAIIDAAAVASCLRERVRGDDLVLPFHFSWTAGLMRNINGHFGPAEGAFGHAGFGGSSVMIDPARKLSAAYVMNRMSPHLVGDPRGLRLVNALYEAL